MNIYIVMDHHQSNQGSEIEGVYSYKPDAEKHAQQDSAFHVEEHEVFTCTAISPDDNL